MDDFEKIFLSYSKTMDNVERLVSRINSSVSNVDGHLSDMKSDLSNTASGINNLDKNFAEQNQHLEENFSEQNEIISQNLSDLNSTLKEGFTQFRELQNKSLELMTVFKDELNSNLLDFQKKSSFLLKNVTTGIALTELLQSAFVSDESDTAIERSVDEHETRYVQVRKEIESRKQLFDKHIEKLFVSFFKQFKQIADHIINIQHRVFNQIDFSEYNQVEYDLNKIEKSDKIRTQLRQEKFDKINSYLEDEAIANFSSLRKKIEDDLSSDNIVHIKSEQDKEIPVLTLPLTLVENNNWDEEDKKFIESYGMNETVESCYDDMETKEVFSRFEAHVDKLRNKTLDTEEGDDDLKNSLLKGLKELLEADYIEKKHYEFMRKHLEKYPLDYLHINYL